MPILYHLAERSVWEVAWTTGVYRPAEDDITCAEAAHYPALANARFSAGSDLALLFIDTARLPTADAWEPAQIGGVPVLRRAAPLPVTAVFEVAPYHPDEQGRFGTHHETSALTLHGDATLADITTRALRAMEGFGRPWWIAGGWAIDLFLGRKTRPHADLEIAILAADQPALAALLHAWDRRVAAPGAAFVPWDGKHLQAPYHQIWARQGTFPADTPDAFSSDPTMLDFLIEVHVGAVWHYRRDARIRRPVEDFGALRDGVPFVRPEIALLYKAKAPRFKDERDWERAAPHLDAAARDWLREALAIKT